MCMCVCVCVRACVCVKEGVRERLIIILCVNLQSKWQREFQKTSGLTKCVQKHVNHSAHMTMQSLQSNCNMYPKNASLNVLGDMRAPISPHRISTVCIVSANNKVSLVPHKKTPTVQTYSAKTTLKEMCVGKSKPDTALPISFAVHVLQSDCTVAHQDNVMKKIQIQGQEIGPHISKYTIWYPVIGSNVSKLVKTKWHKKIIHISVSTGGIPPPHIKQRARERGKVLYICNH